MAQSLMRSATTLRRYWSPTTRTCSFLSHARESYGAPLPRYVEDEFREYLRCGVFAHGFVRARCESCAAGETRG